MDIINLRWLYLVAVLHVLVFSRTILCETEVEEEGEWKLCKNDLVVRNLIELRESFLAGISTPVWITYHAPQQETAIYYKYKNLVEHALWMYSMSHKFEDKRTNYYSSFYIGTCDENFVDNAFSSSSTDRRTNEVYHPSILIVMDYNFDNIDSDTKTDQDQEVYKKVLYALAFWNAVDLQLRYIKNPHVRLRIAGIIIRDDEKAVPYIRQNINWYYGLQSDEAFYSMMKHWRNMRRINDDFPPGSYDIIVTMSDAYSYSTPHYSEHSYGPPCTGSDEDLNGLLFQDNLAFEGIPLAVNGLARIFGAKEDEDCPLKEGHVMATEFREIGRKWSPCTLRQIRSTLINKGSCLREAKEIHPPGKPIETILPGKFMPAIEQCRAIAYKNPIVMWDRITCDYLWCKDDSSYSTFASFPGIPDGTTCGKKKMCLDGKCVSDTPTIDYADDEIYHFTKSAYIASCNKTEPKPDHQIP